MTLKAMTFLLLTQSCMGTTLQDLVTAATQIAKQLSKFVKRTKCIALECSHRKMSSTERSSASTTALLQNLRRSTSKQHVSVGQDIVKVDFCNLLSGKRIKVS